MDKNRFDGFARQLAKRENRRQAIKTLFAGGLGTAAVVVAGGETSAARTDCCPADHPTLCDLTCTDTISSVENCGDCGVTCAAGERCYQGVCESDTIVHCSKASDCPGSDTDCAKRTCKKGVCGVAYTASGKKVSAQTDGDCQKDVCDGAGNIITVIDNADKPAAQGECWTGICVDGVAQQDPRPAGRNCSTGKCDGAGHCVDSTPACTVASDCPATGNECIDPTCTNGVCDTVNVAAGTPLASQVSGNCLVAVCDGNGSATWQPDDTNTPPAGICTISECSNGAPRSFPAPVGTSCPGGVCNEEGICVECVVAADCFGVDLNCSIRSCTNGVCGRDNLPTGTVTADQIQGDCKIRICDGSGFAVDITDSSDVPAQGLPCSHGICENGEAIVIDEDRGVLCPDGYCDGNGACVECLDASHCPDSASECATRTCANGVCGLDFVASGTLTGNQTLGDCQKTICDGAGNIISVADNSDFFPPYYDHPCLDSVCIDGVPSHPPLDLRAPCLGTSGICDGAGNCVQCIDALDCPDSGIAFAETICSSGFCTYQCIAGYSDCVPGGGGCVDTSVNPAHCGMCNHACSVPNGTAGCANGSCAFFSCNSGYADCNNDLSDGCEANLKSDANNCGSCGFVCVSGNCQNGACV